MAGEVKTFEIRDAATFIPAMAIRLDPQSEEDRYLYARAGYGLSEGEQRSYVILWRLNGGEANHDPHGWQDGSNTMGVAHEHIIQNWDQLESGQVIDVEHLLGLRYTPKTSESVQNPLVASVK